MSPVASRQNPKPIEVYSSFNSTLPTNISLRKKNGEEKRQKTAKQVLASGEALCTQKRITTSKSWSIEMPQYWTVPKREMHTDMFLLVVCYASAWSCLCCFPSSVWNLSRFKEDSFHLQCNPHWLWSRMCVQEHAACLCCVSISVWLLQSANYFADTLLKEASAAISSSGV